MFPTKININIPADAFLSRYSLHQNERIVSRGFADIDFRTSRQLPHLTLLTGMIQSEADFIRLKDIVLRVSKEHHPFSFNLTAPYIAPGGHFCFVGVTVPAPFFALKRELAALATSFMSFDFHGGPENPPHLTLGYFNQKQSTLAPLALDEFVQESWACKIALSLSGNRGSCIRDLSVFDFPSDHEL